MMLQLRAHAADAAVWPFCLRDGRDAASHAVADPCCRHVERWAQFNVVFFTVLAVRIAHGNPVSVRSCVIISTNMGRSRCHLNVYLSCVRGIILDPCGIHFPQKVARFI